jgi:peptidoglycan/xylan/chitin deacetylase (PgdA/CDA1 family)
MPSYKTSAEIFSRLQQAEQQLPGHLNGAILLLHAGTDARREDKLYNHLHQLIRYLEQKGYSFKRIDQLLQDAAVL